MSSKDFTYILLIAGVSYLLLKKQQQDKNNNKNNNLNLGSGLDQPVGMDLPNLTANQGLATEDSLNQGNISPLGSNEPEQIFGMPLPQGIIPLPSSSLVFSASNPSSAPVSSATPTTTTPVRNTKSQDYIQNISPCGNSFSVRLNDKDNSVINYWYDGTYYYQQTTSTLMKSVAVRITFQQYNDACQSSINAQNTDTSFQLKKI